MAEPFVTEPDEDLENLIAAVYEAEKAARQSQAVREGYLRQLDREPLRLRSLDTEQDYRVSRSTSLADSDDRACSMSTAQGLSNGQGRVMDDAAKEAEQHLQKLQAKKTALELCLEKLTLAKTTQREGVTRKRAKREVLNKVWQWLDKGTFTAPPEDTSAATPVPVGPQLLLSRPEEQLPAVAAASPATEAGQLGGISAAVAGTGAAAAGRPDRSASRKRKAEDDVMLEAQASPELEDSELAEDGPASLREAAAAALRAADAVLAAALPVSGSAMPAGRGSDSENCKLLRTATTSSSGALLPGNASKPAEN